MKKLKIQKIRKLISLKNLVINNKLKNIKGGFIIGDEADGL